VAVGVYIVALLLPSRWRSLISSSDFEIARLAVHLSNSINNGQGSKAEVISLTCSGTDSRRILVRLVSSALTGFFYTTSRTRLADKLAMMKYDPVGELRVGGPTGWRAPVWGVLVGLRLQPQQCTCPPECYLGVG
jgi:large subunit ribosomal protein L33